jgi:hypothetical protein
MIYCKYEDLSSTKFIKLKRLTITMFSRLGIFKRKDKDKDKDKDGGKEQKRAFKCKHCDMEFEDKQRMKLHGKKAHMGRGEAKKK